ncbi:transglutaminase domain-containing protein [Nocardioides sp. JQ2195]|uniref:transglutaminase family protein n=1 Tax=Nocardioides sp. JQ2195 TaxID=2592334 RepID=UPI00143E3813|nr:DUF3488 and transglutaminase-like domain-containing protein [Nocardioides sp. JQ2195]QIX26353.1 transglutaminase domain-containing protein [Nocardioides sp. JQ2195]
MTGHRNGPGPILLVLATAMTSWFTLSSWGGFVETNAIYMVPLLSGILCVSLVGQLSRWARFHVVVIAAAQLLTAFLFLNFLHGNSPLPTPSSITATTQAFVDALEVSTRYAAPIPTEVKEVAPLLVFGGLLCHLFVDLIAVTLNRVPVAGLPLLIVYTLPVSILDRPVHWAPFVLGVSGFLLMLVLQENSRISRWGRQFGATDTGPFKSTMKLTDARRHPVAVGATAVTLALFIPLLIPTLDLGVLGGEGSGGPGDREVKITNPMTDLRRDLIRGEDVPLLEVSTDGPAPEYVRLTVLTKFTDAAWSPGKRKLPESQAADGAIPNPIGLTGAYPTTTRDWKISITDELDSLWLPTPMRVTSVNASSDWRYDINTLDFHSADDDVNTAGMDYSLTELIPQLNGDGLASAPPPPSVIADDYTALPDMPQEVVDIAREVTGGQASDYEKAQALQDYFRGPEFEYSLTPDPGNGNNALVEFLQDKEGYCEQFSSAMAVMARILGIPARVAVGLHYSDDDSDATDGYEFTSHDLHAWPELYFEGAGWVIFEPTPSTHIPGVPGYTNDQVEDDGPDAQPTAPQTSASPQDRPTKPRATQAPEEQATADKDQDDDFSLVPFLWGGGALLVVVALVLTPRSLRRARTNRRWRVGDPAEAAWAELRDVTVDLGRAWPAGRSPRATGQRLLEFFGPAAGTESSQRPRTGPEVNPEATAALHTLVGILERSRYSDSADPSREGEIRQLVDSCVAALRGGATAQGRRRATWWPRSVLSAGSRTAARASGGARRASAGDPLDQIS